MVKKAKTTKARKTKAQPKRKTASPAVTTSAAAADPFDLGSLSLPQDFDMSGVKRVMTTVPVRKPKRQEFIRVHPTLRGVVALIEDKTDREEYLVSDPDRKGFINALSGALPGEVVSKQLYLTVTRQGDWFLWPIRLPRADGKKEMDWTLSSREAAQMAIDTWLRVASNLNIGAYDIFSAAKITTDPVWPEENWQQILRVAFRSRVITTFDHTLIKQLTGE